MPKKNTEYSLINDQSKCANCKHLKRFVTKSHEVVSEQAICTALNLKWKRGDYHPPIMKCDAFSAASIIREVGRSLLGD